LAGRIDGRASLGKGRETDGSGRESCLFIVDMHIMDG